MKNTIIISVIFLVSILTMGQETNKITFTVEGMTCNACANTATKTLQAIKGAVSASVDFESKLATVTGAITEEDVRAAIRNNTNFEVLFKGESLIKPLSKEELASLDIETIKGGNKLKFKDHLAKGKLTVFDFYADWCAPCRVFSPKVEWMIKETPNAALRKVDIVDWKSAVAKQLTKVYSMPALPFTLVFDDTGKLLGKVEGNDIEQVKSILNKNNK